MKNWTKSYLCMVVPIYSGIPAFYRQKPRGERREKIGGANAPPNKRWMVAETQFWSRFRGHGVARWPHEVGGNSPFDDTPLSLAGFPVSAPGFDETAFDFGFNHLIWEDSF